MNKGRKNMREALGMTMETSSTEAILRFWMLGEFLELGTPQKNAKIDKDLINHLNKKANTDSVKSLYTMINYQNELIDDFNVSTSYRFTNSNCLNALKKTYSKRRGSCFCY